MNVFSINNMDVLCGLMGLYSVHAHFRFIIWQINFTSWWIGGEFEWSSIQIRLYEFVQNGLFETEK